MNATATTRRSGRRVATALALATALAVIGGGAAQASEGLLGSAAPATAGGSTAARSTAATTTSTLASGAHLSVGGTLTSPNGNYRVVLQSDGNAVVYGPRGALWSTVVRGTRLAMQTDGNLVLYTAAGKAAWNSKTARNPGASAVLGDDGRFRVLSSTGVQLWSSPADPAAATDRLATGGTLTAGKKLTSGTTTLAMQTDGNLVRYESGTATWQSGTRGSNARLVLQSDGNLVVYTDKGAVWNTRTAGKGGTSLVLRSDTNVVLFAGTKALWMAGVTRDLQVLALVNAERAKVGCAALRTDARLAMAATLHSEDMRDKDYFDHTSPTGTDPSTRVAAQGYPGGAGENIAAGYQTPAAVMDAWMHSPGHKANILDCDYVAIGVGSAVGGSYGLYWTQDFGLV